MEVRTIPPKTKRRPALHRPVIKLSNTDETKAKTNAKAIDDLRSEILTGKARRVTPVPEKQAPV